MSSYPCLKARNIGFAILVIIASTLQGCVRSSVLPLSADTIQITTSAARVCGRTGAQSAAARRAAIETINRGYDSYLILGQSYANNLRVLGYSPITAESSFRGTASGYGSMTTIQGHGTTTYSGGDPIMGGSHDQGVVVKMFRDGDPAGANSISARGTLGPDWRKMIEEGQNTTCG